MAFNTETKGITPTPIPEIQPEVQSEPTTAFVAPEPIEQKPDLSEVQGLTEVELNDPNTIDITIADRNTPIVVLFGPPACGKTMTLVRLTRYLKENGYKVEPIRTFRPSYDRHYTEMCDKFNEMITDSNAAQSTSMLSFMLVKVLDSTGRPICQILEAPGELYYSPGSPNAPFPRYVNAIKNGSNRKVWCYMVEPDWMDEKDRLGYVDKIAYLKKNMKTTDKAVFIFNKIDLTPFVISPGKINEKQAKKYVEDLYPGIFVPFKSKAIFGTNNNFKFVPFQTGDYSKTFSGDYSYDSGPDEYPNALWNVIKKIVTG